MHRQRATSFYFLAVLCCVAVMGKACRDYDNTKAEVDTISPHEVHCQTSDHCPRSTLCDNGLCVADCRVAQETCVFPQVCDFASGFCVALENCATTMQHCPSGYYCVAESGSCVQGSRSCFFEDVACSKDQYCSPRDWSCKALPPDCRFPGVSCPGGFHCELITGRCEAHEGDCRNGTFLCPEGSRCNLNTGSCEFGVVDCRVNQCPNGLECVVSTGACVFSEYDCRLVGCETGRCDISIGACIEAADCRQEPALCNEDQYCDLLVGLCRDYSDKRCSEGDCPAGQYCNPLSRRCMDNDCRLPGFACPVGTVCLYATGKCSDAGYPDCRETDCNSDLVCDEDRGLCVEPDDCRRKPWICTNWECDFSSGQCID